MSLILLAFALACSPPHAASDAAEVECDPVGYRRPGPECVDLFLCEQADIVWFQTRPPNRSTPAARFPEAGCDPTNGPCMTAGQRAAESWACR